MARTYKNKRTNLPEKLFFSATQDFYDYLDKTCRKSQRTINTYRGGLKAFRIFLKEEKDYSILNFTYDDCTKDIILDFCSSMTEKGLKNSTRNNRLAAVKSYLFYLADQNDKIAPIAVAVSHIKCVRVEEPILPVLNDAAILAMISAPEDTRIGNRDRVIMAIIYDTGIRLSEVLGIVLSDIHLEQGNPRITIRGKGNKERIVPVGDKTVGHLTEYIQHYHNDSSSDTPLIFVDHGHGKESMCPRNVERIIKKYADKIRSDYPDLPKTVYPHMLRRSRFTELYQKGVDIELIARTAGHKSIETTKKHYAKESIEMLREAMENAPGVPKVDREWSLDAEEEAARLCGLL